MKNYTITVNGNVYEVEVEEAGGEVASSPVAAAPAAAPVPAASAAPKAVPSGTAGSVTVNCPMPGTVLYIKAKVGDSVKTGDTILILEAMKMENEITAPSDGTIASINVSQGASVNTGDILATLN